METKTSEPKKTYLPFVDWQSYGLSKAVPSEVCDTIVKYVEKRIPEKKETTFPNQLRFKIESDELKSTLKLFIEDNLDKEFIMDETRYEYSDISSHFTYVSYETSEKLAAHFDAYTENDAQFAMIVYLNDEYTDGQTFYKSNHGDFIRVASSKGSILCLKGDKILHGSRKVKGNKKILIGKLLFKRKTDQP